MTDKFPGFLPPTENYSKLPHQMIDALPLIETVSEMKVILYVLRHTWGFQEFDELKRITLDEFQKGRKRKDGSRFDGGTGLSANAIKDGIARAIKHGFLIQVSDGRDFGRSSHVYQLRVSNSDTVSDPDNQPSNSDSQSSEVDSQPSKPDTRSEKETPERNSQKETEKETADFPEETPAPTPPSPDPGDDSRKEQDDDDEISKDGRGNVAARGSESLDRRNSQDSVGTALPAELQVRNGLLPPDGISNSGSSEEAPCPLMMPFERATAAVRAESGNYAVPAQAGGDDAAGEAALVAMYAALDSEPPREGTGAWKSQLEIFSKILRDCGLTDPEMAAEAGRRFGKANLETPHFANPHLSTFPASFGLIVGRVKKKAQDEDDRRVRTVAHAQASQAAFEERKAARPPPVEDDAIGAAIKAVLQIQMDRATYHTWVKPTAFACDDGALVVTAVNAFAKDWLENRLAVTIRRVLDGFPEDAPKEVRFEVQL